MTDAQLLAVEATAKDRKRIYEANKEAEVGQEVTCPFCGKKFVKRYSRQAFCSSKGKGNCKDRYWNQANSKRRARASWYGNAGNRRAEYDWKNEIF